MLYSYSSVTNVDYDGHPSSIRRSLILRRNLMENGIQTKALETRDMG